MNVVGAFLVHARKAKQASLQEASDALFWGSLNVATKRHGESTRRVAAQDIFHSNAYF